VKLSPIPAVLFALVSLSLPACSKEEHVEELKKIVPTYPQSQAVTLTQQYVCQIHSQRHIQVRALEMGYLEAITVKEGQAVKEGDLLFKVIPILYQKNAEVRQAEASLAELQYKYSQQLLRDDVVSKNEVLLLEAKMKRAQATAEMATAELNFATVKASFDGIIDRLYQQQGSLVQKGEVLTTMSDNSTMWVYFNIPEARYLEYISNLKPNEELQIELMLANGQKFSQLGKMVWDGTSWKTGAIEADFNNQTGNISFRADFPNPDRLLRHGQTGTVLISKVQRDAIVIPQKATFEVLAKRYVYVVDDDNVAHQREIAVEHNLDDIFVVKSGVDASEKIVLEGIQQIRDGDKVEIEAPQTEQVAAANLSST
jgi:membrane fusion protein (multidrug efflux system)